MNQLCNSKGLESKGENLDCEYEHSIEKDLNLLMWQIQGHTSLIYPTVEAT